MFELKDPAELQLDSRSIPIFSLCEFDRRLATINQTRFNEINKKVTRNKGTVYFVDSIINYMPEQNVWNHGIGVRPSEMTIAATTVYRFTGNRIAGQQKPGRS